MSSSTAILCRGVTKNYGRGASEVRALRGIDLEVRLGELLMLIGPSGCGKTTLISVMAGILDQTDGDCSVLGENLRRLRGRRRTKFRGRNVGFVFQQFNLLPALTAAENVAVPLMLNGVGRTAAVRKGRELLARVGLGDRTRSLPAQLSGGQQQRVAIARALAHEPRIIVCDEPTSALDHDTGQQVMELLREVAVRPDRSLVIVTHDARIFGFADRIARMDDGHIERIVTSPDQLRTPVS
ncbi:MAG: ABC transporter ATP-binding protein [Phycisphaerales bacterium]|nr:ABC transporter ATP-binding protein [Phycisphaerales bacterium]